MDEFNDDILSDYMDNTGIICLLVIFLGIVKYNI